MRTPSVSTSSRSLALLLLGALLSGPSPTPSASPGESRAQLEAWGRQSAKALASACKSSREKYLKLHDQLESEYMVKSAKHGEAAIAAWSEEAQDKRVDSSFLNLGRFVWPLVASPGIPGLAGFQECGKLADQLHAQLAKKKSLTKAALEPWEGCIALHYRESLPELLAAQRTCLRSLLK